jgi:hypothetical protein
MWSWFSFFIGYLIGWFSVSAGLLLWGFILEARTTRVISKGRTQ